MQIILIQDVEKLGNEYDVLTVKDGFGRNYLIPQGKALVANKTNLANLKEKLRQIEYREGKMLGTYQAEGAKAAAVTLTIPSKAGASGKLFGSIQVSHIVEALKEKGVEIDRKKVKMPEEVKELGEYVAMLTFHKEVVVPVTFHVVAINAPEEEVAAEA